MYTSTHILMIIQGIKKGSKWSTVLHTCSWYPTYQLQKLNRAVTTSTTTKKKKKCKAILGKATVNIEKYSMLTWPNLKNIPWTQSQNLMKFSAFVCITEKWKSWKFQLFWLKGSWHMAFRNFNPFRLWGDFWTMSYIKSL